MLLALLYSQWKLRINFVFCILLLSTYQLISLSYAQAFAGTYNDVVNQSNELILTYESDGLYTGVLFEEIDIFSIQATEENATLKIVILKSRAGAEEDAEFLATLENGLLSLKSIVSDTEITYARPGKDIETDVLENVSVEPTNTLIQTKSGSSALMSYSVKTGSLTGEVVQPDQQYWGGTQLQIPSVGIAFEIPSAGTAIHTPPQQTIVIGHTSTLGNVSISALSAGDFDSFVASHLKTDDGQVLKMVSGPVETSDSYRAAFELESDERRSYIEVAAQKGLTGNMVLFKAKSRLPESEDISLVVDMLLESLVFSNADDISLQTTVANQRVTTSSNIIDTCSNGEFRIESAEDSQVGLWKYTSSIFSSGITLNSISGDFYYIPLESEDGIIEGETGVSIEVSPYCQ